MKHFVERTCTVVPGREEERGGETESSRWGEAESRALEAFREVAAYVLLGSPGAGKTEAFKSEAGEEGGHYITARDFLTFDPEPEWEGRTIYIDGLDETRAGAFGGRTPFDRIRAKLQRLGRPPFRISCREADWFGANDRERLSPVAPNGEVQVLRLDPLSDQGVLEILERNHDVDNPAAFVAEARTQGVEDLLRNPQNLRMLAEAVAEAEEWPRTRTKTLDLACRKLVSEENPEHQIACSGTFNTKALLDGAGDLCALLLLAGKAGVTLPGTMPDANHPPLDQVPRGNQQLLRRVVGTNLFTMPREGRLAPVHRQIAEFLAAWRLADLIAEGLPVRRVLSLVTGFDGGIISEFRGLAAWLAALSQPARAEIIERDPLGVLHGDIRDFGPDEKGWLFDSLGREVDQHPWLLRDPSLILPLGDLAAPKLERRFRDTLAKPPTSEAAATVARVVLQVFDSCKIPRGFGKELLSIVRDSKWPPPIRYQALKLIFRMRDEEVEGRLLSALHHVYHREQDRVTRDEIAGRLLAELYPSGMSITQAAKYLRHPGSNASYDWYVHFWRDLVVERSGPGQLVELLSILEKRMDSRPDPWRPGPDGLGFPSGLPWRCLKALMTRSPSRVKPSLLYYWIGASLSNPFVDLDADALTSWLSSRPGTRRSLVQLAGSDNQSPQARQVAVVACRAGHKTDQLPDGLHVHFAAEPSPEDRPQIHHPPAADRHDGGYDRRALDPQFETSLREQCEHMRANLDEIRANRCPPVLLHNLAQAYLGRFAELWAPTGRERVSRMLRHKDDLVDCALAALRGAIARSDLPTPSELVRLTTEGRLHLLARPVMAGLRERAGGDHAKPPPLDDRQARLAITIWYTTGEPPRSLRQSPGEPLPKDDLGGVPDWLTALREARPAVAADVLVAVSRTLLRSGREPKHGYHSLVHPSGSDQLPKLATLRLLDVFPVRCHSRLLPHLRDLLVAACRHCDGAEFMEVIAKKLQYKSMSVGQRVQWLTAGQIVAPAKYSDRLESFVAEKQRREPRVRHLTTMLVGRGGLPRQLEETWGVPVLTPLIRLLGSSYRRSPEVHAGVAYDVTLEMEATTCVNRYIDRLAMLPTGASTAALAELSGTESLRNWSDKLSAAAYRQWALRREAEFRHPGVEQVGEVLGNRRPANAADLWALTVDVLRQLSREIRDGATSDWRQYWNVDQHNRARNPKPENACRDALLSELHRELTPLGVDGVREGSYKDDKRADIRLSAAPWNVPIEIKRSCHPDWWSSIKTQLIAKYTRDPGTDGYGVYLVFWFGEADGCRPVPASGRKPKSPYDIRQALLSTLSDHERRKISVLVIDVSKPAA